MARGGLDIFGDVTPVRPRATASALVKSRRRFGAILALPGTFLVLLLTLGPALQTVLFSLFEVNLNGASTFVGIGNYVRLAGDPAFMASVRTTAIFTAATTLLATALGLAFALLLHQPFRWRSIGRTLLLVPWAAPALISGLMWKWFADGDVGGLNGLLYQLGIIDDYIPFLAYPGASMVLVIVATAWRFAALSGLLILAALQAIPHELPEAATVDGANHWQRFRYVTLPWIRPAVLIVLITNVVAGILQFDLIYAMTGGGPGDATTVVSMRMYQQVFVFSEIGLGSASAVLLGLAAFASGLVFVWFLYRSQAAHRTAVS